MDKLIRKGRWKAVVFSLILGIIWCTTPAFAQVRMYYLQDFTGQVDQTSLAQVRVSNFTGVTIHYLFKGLITTPDGQVLLEVKSEVLQHQYGTTDFREEHIDGPRTLNVDPFAGLQVLQSVPNWQTYTGPVVFESQLVHPLDTSSIIAHIDQELFLSNGYFTDAEGNYLTDPKMVEVEFNYTRENHFRPEDLAKYLEVDNRNSHPHCAVLFVTLRQGEHELYQVRYKAPCIGVGKQEFSADDFEVLIDDYASRSMHHGISVEVTLGSIPSGPLAYEFMSAAMHGQFAEGMKTYRSEALGISLEYFHTAFTRPAPLLDQQYLFFNEAGDMTEMRVGAFQQISYALPLDFPSGFYLSREDVNGVVTVVVRRRSDLSEAEWRSLFAFRKEFDPEDIICQKVGDIALWKPPVWGERMEGNIIPLDYQSYMLGIEDGDRMILINISRSIYDRSLPGFTPQPNELDVPAVFNSLRYHGLSFRAVTDDDGNLLDVETGNPGALTDAAVRRDIFDRYCRYATILGTKEASYMEAPAEVVPPDLDALDRQVAEQPDLEPFSIEPMTKISPDHDPVRQFVDNQWEAAGITFSCRKSEDYDDVPLISRTTEVYQLDERDSVLNVKVRQYVGAGSNSEIADVQEKSIVLSSETFNLTTVPGQGIFIRRSEPDALTEKEIMIITRRDNTGRARPGPDIQIISLGDWTIYTSDQLVNAMWEYGFGNSFTLRTPNYLYRISLKGGFESDIVPFFNSLRIEGEQLQFRFDRYGFLEEVKRR